MSLKHAWDSFPIDFTHFQDTNENTFVSSIDHFFWNSLIEDNILEAGVIHHRDNMSDHSPIYCVVDVDNIPDETATKDTPPSNPNNHLSNISLPEEVKNCRNVHCKDPNHAEQSDEYISILLGCIENAATEALCLMHASMETEIFLMN